MNAHPAGRLVALHEQLAGVLRSELGSGSNWTGDLSSSALSTATALIALSRMASGREEDPALVNAGLEWLARHANSDGGWGDTTRSRSNLSTTCLVWGAFGAAEADARFSETMAGATAYILKATGSMERLVPTIEGLYGEDRTFSVPITMALALSGRLGPDGWRRVRPLPFELAALPRGWFGALRLPVVSYALPALIAIGQVIHQRSGRFHPLRTAVRSRTLEVLAELQPPNGGFLEATPLTSFVTMSLAGMGLARHPVAVKGAAFLRASARPDGSWPIDTNLATWVTTLAVKALAGDGQESAAILPEGAAARVRAWLLAQQYQTVHPYTGAAPGGWAWTDLPGGVPDADDTPGALLALRRLGPPDPASLRAVERGVGWLLDLQNRDGGIPTFCRGWGTLPFDRSTPEITAHVLRAWHAWLPLLSPGIAARVTAATSRARRYLRSSQRPDGAWEPLWFGNEAAPGQANPVYGTAQVLIGLREIGSGADGSADLVGPATRFLVASQNAEGGWGGARGVSSSLEETALALSALTGLPAGNEAVSRGTTWFLDRLEAGAWREPAPIGLYFARLWYHERLYPLVFAVDALRRIRAQNPIR